MSTPSSRLDRRQKKDAYNFGPWYDHYVRPFGKCHPSFDTILLNDDPRGVKVCVRKPELEIKESIYPSFMVYRYARNLYEPWDRSKNFDNVSNETGLIASDYLKLNQDFNGTGVLTYRTCLYESFSSLY